MWASKLRKASFRGVQFSVESAETEGGRRSVTHEFPNKETPYTEDVGRKAKSIQIEAFLIGADYMAYRDALITVLDKKGPGVLVHPYFGEMTLSVKTWRLKETANDGGMATFSIQFSETGELIFPSVSDNAIAKLLRSADVLEKTAAERFAAIFSAASGKALAAAVNALNAIAGILDQLLTPFAVLTTMADVLSRDISKMTSLATTLARRPLAMLYRMQNALKRLVSLGKAGSSVTRSYANAAKSMSAFFDGQPAVTTTPSGRRIASNNKAMNVAMCAMTVAAGARAIVQNQFASEEEAIETRNALADQAQEIAQRSDDDALFMAAIDLRIRLYEAIPGDNANLKRVTSVDIPVAMPALVLSYRTFGNINSEADIIARNDIEHPSMLPPGTYKVLSQ